MVRDEDERAARGEAATRPTQEHVPDLDADERAGDERDVSLPVSVEKIVTRDLPHEESQNHE